MNIFDGVLQFQGTWRTYQKRVLDNGEKYLADGKIHIVAAPGSGKTTLGIELIRRLGAPCLILSPSITIRQQWLERMAEGFLQEGYAVEEWFSNDLRNIRPVTVITYQALHSAMKHYAGVLKEETESGEEDRGEVVDYQNFDIFEAVKAAGIRTICLDEAHHLRSEWWKALESFIKEMPDMAVISLTATPPYDSTPAQWKRYTDLCGPIDEEIFTPELVKEGSLCPHQDYVYFNWPKDDEIRIVKEYTERTKIVVEELSHDREFIRMVANHRGILDPEEYSEFFLDRPKYFSSILIFLHAAGVPFSGYLIELTGTKGNFPKLDNGWMETLLQGFLYEDTEAYPCDKVYREELIGHLKSAGCIHRNKVQLTNNDKVAKLLVSSKGKLDSINDIVEAEYESLGSELRLLILCDFIKKEMLSMVGNADKTPGELGAVPIFEYIRRRELRGVRLGVLSGSVVIVPSDAYEALNPLFGKYGCEGSLTPLGDTGYSRVSVKGSGHHIVSMITELFTCGQINVLVGTKSLLGEGWDSPCINSLILATYVGSFMLSNQMRGRAIRVFKDQPDKTSNIWHLACVFPTGLESSGELSGDYETLKRRFEAFLGVSALDGVIESGIERLGLEKNLDSRKDIERCNQRTMKIAGDRKGLRETWKNDLKVIYDDMRVEEVEEVDKKILEPGYLFLNAVVIEIISVILFIFSILIRAFGSASAENLFLPGIIIYIAMAASFFGICKYGYRIGSLCTPQKRMKKAACGILDALMQTGKLEEPLHCRVMTEEAEAAVFTCLKGGNTRDKTLFAECLEEFWGVIDNPRYLLVLKKGRWKMSESYAIPDIFGKKKEDALCFAACMRKAIGPYEAVYTRNPEGRGLLLKARTKSFVNKNDKILHGKKRVKGEFE
ncbi:DEAD/DEAH box helicase family protein [Frisingicoccus sp.]|uniref:DEAD/DEAH box helicase family protein n=1 Tax=Frisingicoccus sp. TaxID=1918627 RepID=UPI003AB50F96